MKLTIDTDRGELRLADARGERTLPLYSPEAFEALTREWLRVGWDQKHAYTFTWMGRPIIQLPEDLVRLQEAVHLVRPDLVIETGVAHGGGLVFYASLLKALGHGRVVGVERELRPHNREVLAKHPLAPLIDIVEGDSTAPETVAKVRRLATGARRVLVVLDSDHRRDHVRAELEAYHPLVTPGAYLIVADGLMADLHDVPRGQGAWAHDNPRAAVHDFLAAHPEFESAGAPRPFSESPLRADVTHFPGGWLRRREVP